MKAPSITILDDEFVNIAGLSPADREAVRHLIIRLSASRRWVARFAYPEHGLKGRLARAVVTDYKSPAAANGTIKGFDLARKAHRQFKTSRIHGGRIEWKAEYVNEVTS